ncbi:MAG: hypothetical protein O7H41_04500 [Planctomycetota bacterium]|nr:hypothetical protein [Planctomycetota bacterium]
MSRILITSMALALLASAGNRGEVKWSIDAPAEKIPDGKLRGEIFGRDIGEFMATFNDQAITIQSKEKVEGWPASKLIIFADRDARSKEIVVTPKSEGMLPHVHMNSAIEGRGFPGTLMYTEMYSMRLVAKEIGDSLDCQIHLSLPDYKHTFLAGRFTAKKN